MDKPQHPKPRYVVAFRPEYVDLLDGDHLAALMLCQIVYWYRPDVKGKRKLRVYKPDTKTWWLVKSHVDWTNELRMTRGQSQRCLEVLRRKGLIETCRKLFNGHPTIHLRCTLISGNILLEAKIEDLLMAMRQRVKSISDLGEAMHCSPVINALDVEERSITENTHTDDFIYLASQYEPIGEEKNTTKTQAKQKMEDVDFGEAELADDPLHSGDESKPFSIASCWSNQMMSSYGGVPKTLTMKELGQLKDLCSKIKMTGLDSGKFLTWLFDRWQDAATTVRIEEGLEVVPVRPNIGFSLKYVHYMLSDFKKREAELLESSQLPKPEPYVSPPAKVFVPPDPPATFTPEEIAATFALL